MSEPRRYTLDDLLTLMAVLRDPRQGCPWDVEQHWDSIVPHTLEEAYEVADAIDRRAFDELPGELGDLLFQVIYYSRFGEEEGRFDFFDVVDTLVTKMIARHPHVFPDGTLASRRRDVPTAAVETDRVSSRWENLKARERDARAATSLLDDVPRGLPALSRATKLTKRAARVGFDWAGPRDVIAKVHEELGEVEEALGEDDADHVQEEIGDLLFVVANLARKLDIDPEQALRGANAKFERRFSHVEHSLAAAGQVTGEVSLAQMERYWDDAKRRERDENHCEESR